MTTDFTNNAIKYQNEIRVYLKCRYTLHMTNQLANLIMCSFAMCLVPDCQLDAITVVVNYIISMVTDRRSLGRQKCL